MNADKMFVIRVRKVSSVLTLLFLNLYLYENSLESECNCHFELSDVLSDPDFRNI